MCYILLAMPKAAAGRMLVTRLYAICSASQLYHAYMRILCMI